MNPFDDFLDNFKDCFFNYTVTVSRLTQTKNVSDGTYSSSYANVITGLVAFMEKSGSSLGYRGERLQPHVDAYIIVQPKNLGAVVLQDNDKITVSNGEIYTFKSVDDVDGFGEMLEIGMNRYENG